MLGRLLRRTNDCCECMFCMRRKDDGSVYVLFSDKTQMSSSRSQIIPRHRIIWDRICSTRVGEEGAREKRWIYESSNGTGDWRRMSDCVENLNPNTKELYWSGKFRSLPNFWFHWFRKTWWDHRWKTFSEEISGTGSGWSESFITGQPVATEEWGFQNHWNKNYFSGFQKFKIKIYFSGFQKFKNLYDDPPVIEKIFKNF